LMRSMVGQAPLRSLLMAGEGRINRPMLEALLLIINGHFFRGAAALARAFLRK
jgi:hypothetical protein